MLPYIVIDLSVSRDENAISAALRRCCRENLQLLLPDGAGHELSKGPRPADTWKRSLELVAPFREFVSVGRKLTHLRRQEAETGAPFSALIDEGGTDRFRCVLEKLANGDPSAFDMLNDDYNQRRIQESKEVWSDNERHKEWIRFLVNEFKKTLTQDQLSELRRAPKEAIAQYLSSLMRAAFVFQGIRAVNGISDEVALLLESSESVNGAWFAAMAALGLYWLAFGGLDNTRATTSTNDWLDTEYIALGSLCRELLTRDKRMKIIHDAVSAARRRHVMLLRAASSR